MKPIAPGKLPPVERRAAIIIQNYTTAITHREEGGDVKPSELKREYVRLRAEGQSYSRICEQLHISKSTCTKWEKALAAQIDEVKRAELAELCEGYSMTKAARIRRLGETLDKINAALERTDFSKVDPAKLLDFKLKYTEALKGEYAGTIPAPPLESVDAKGILAALADLLRRVRAGETSTEQAQKESAILSQLLKAYDTVEVKAKLDELEAIIGRRA